MIHWMTFFRLQEVLVGENLRSRRMLMARSLITMNRQLFPGCVQQDLVLTCPTRNWRCFQWRNWRDNVDEPKAATLFCSWHQDRGELSSLTLMVVAAGLSNRLSLLSKIYLSFGVYVQDKWIAWSKFRLRAPRCSTSHCLVRRYTCMSIMHYPFFMYRQ